MAGPSPSTSEVLQARLEEFTRTCRGHGLKITPQRLEIFRELAATPDHPGAETVYRRIRTRLPHVSLDTVYRTLATLQQHGMIQRVEILDSARFDANLEPHAHLVCPRCQRVKDVDWPALEQALERLQRPEILAAWGSVERIAVEIRAVCPACIESTPAHRP